MNSDFGADIFDAGAPAERKVQRPAKREHTRPEPAEPADAPPPAAAEPADDRRPHERARERERTADDRERGRERHPPRPAPREHPRTDAADDDRPRRGRRRRRGRGRGEPRDEGSPAGPRRELPAGLAAPEPAGRAQRIAVFVDAEQLAAQAADHRGEIAYRRLLQRLSRGRPLVRAAAYLTARNRALGATLAAHGLEIGNATGGATAVAIAVDAMAVSDRVDCVILVPGHPDLEPLIRALRGHGVRVESAGFEEGAAGDPDGPAEHHRLGRECLFVP
jgi:hypothetical protein